MGKFKIGKQSKGFQLFKEAKKPPIKFAGYKFIGFHNDYKNIAYYVRELQHNNFCLLEANLEVSKKKFVLSAGTSIKVLDSMMYYYLTKAVKDSKYIESDDFKKFVTNAVNDSFKKEPDTVKEALIKKYSSKVPKELNVQDGFMKAKKEGFKVLYCSNDESPERKFAIVDVVMVKEQDIDAVQVKRHYTVFRCFNYMTKPSYIKGKGLVKYNEYTLPDLAISHDILNK